MNELLHSVRSRRSGTSALVAVGEFISGLAEWAEQRRPTRPTTSFRRLIDASPTLQDHRRAMFARWEAALTAVLTSETGAAPGATEPFVAAASLVAVVRAGFETPHGSDPSGALDLLATGLRDYARRS